jgi:hypothetical protein
MTNPALIAFFLLVCSEHVFNSSKGGNAVLRDYLKPHECNEYNFAKE